jgi:hypothetical protein
MAFLALTATALVSAIVLSLALRGSRWNQVWLLVGGVLLFASATLVGLVTDCEGCTPEIAPWLAALALAGWFVGIGAGLLLRRRTLRRPGRSSVLVACVLLAIPFAAVAYGRETLNVVRWGCPSQEELQRNQSVEDVVLAFARTGMPLQRIPPPVWLPPREPAYRGAQVFRYRADGATTYVMVCRQRCAVSRFRFGKARKAGEQRWRLGMSSNNNVPIWVTETGSRGGSRMLEAIRPALREVHPSIEYGSRCYIG